MPAATIPKTHFRTLQKFKSEYSPTEIAHYESERTGLRVVVANQKGPKVQGYFALATEIHDDSGAPHTLEHLVFMGSRTYKYKGVLDKLATRLYSSTNAWTATDNTTYTLDTAGWAAFAELLPVYLEHVLLPTLSDAGCYTEVHHIDGSGNDAGVVYSEMQGVENNQAELMELQARRIIYPEGVGFRYETGGMTKNLRVLTADRIREFHKEMYQPKNMRLVLIGDVDHDHLLDVLEKFEDTVIDQVPPYEADFDRPWMKAKLKSPLDKTTVDTVKFPEEDESTGEIMIGFLGPDFLDFQAADAFNVLQVYLAGSSVSVLENVIVEKEQLASGVYYSVENRPNTLLWYQLSNVATSKLAEVEKRFFALLKDTASKPFDMTYMHDCIRRWIAQIKFYAENNASFFMNPIIEDHCFGLRDGTSLRQLGSLETLENLYKWSDKQWREFFSKWIADAHHVSILGVPSKELSDKLKKDEETRVEKQKKELGEEGLKRLAKKLEEAKAENDKPIPESLLEGIKIPGAETIHFIPTTTARSGLAKKEFSVSNDIQKVIDKDAGDLPLYIHFEDIPTTFVHFSLVLNTSNVPLELKPLLAVYKENFFNTPIIRDGKRMEFEEVVTALEKDTISYTIDDGSAVGNSELLRIRFQVEADKYEKCIEWLREFLFESIFDVERLKATVTKMLAEVPEEKRSGNSMLYAVSAMTLWAPEASSRAVNTLVKALYLKRIKKLLDSSPDTVIDQLTTLRKSLTNFSNFRVLVIANCSTLPNPASSWKTLLKSIPSPSLKDPTLSPLDSRRAVLSPLGKSPGSSAYIIPMATIDSSFAVLAAKAPDSYTHPDLAALMVAIAYLDSVEGPLWVAVRGSGLAYGTGFSQSVDSALLTFRIYRSPDTWKAFESARETCRGYATGEKPFERLMLEGAVSQIVMGFADEQPTMATAATVGFVYQVVKGVPKNWSEVILKEIRGVSEERIREVMRKWILPAFEPETANLVVTCATIMEEALKKKFEEAGFKPEVQPLTHFQDDYGLKTGDDDEDPDDEDDDDEEDGETGSEEESDEDKE